MVDDDNKMSLDSILLSKFCNSFAESGSGERNVEKQSEIEKVSFSFDSKDIVHLRLLAISEGGLLSNSLRKKAWPILLELEKEKEKTNNSSKNIIPNDSDSADSNFENVTPAIVELVNLDVGRVLKRFPPGLSDPQQDHLQTCLTALICKVLDKNPNAFYYQGFHDIALTFLLVFISQQSPNLSFDALNTLINTSLSPYMEESMEKTHNYIHVLFAILEREDNELYNKIVIQSKCPVAFCLAWVICWFAHTLPNDTDIFRLYDFILGTTNLINPSALVSVFISAALVLRNSSKIKNSVTENDIATMHQALSKLPSEVDSLETWLDESLKLMKKYMGKERELLKRGVEIRTLQYKLMNEETVTRNNRRRGDVYTRSSAINRLTRFIFVRHRWTTLAIVFLGAAFLFQQSKHSLSFEDKFNSSYLYLKKYYDNISSRIYDFLYFEIE